MKLALVGLLLFSVLAPELPQFAGKAMTARALTYPLAALAVPVLWWFRGRARPYPHLVDLLVVLPFVIDLAGNALDLYVTTWFDGVAHFLNWALLVAAVGVFLGTTGLRRLIVWGLAVGFGASTHIVWEIVEYGVMALGSSGLSLTYEDTIADLALSFGGSLAGATASVTLLWPRTGSGPRPRHS